MSILTNKKVSLTLVALFFGAICAGTVSAQSNPGAPVVVRPGAPGQPSRTLPASTVATLPRHVAKDAEFMQGMIMHHAQAVEMTDMIAARTENKGVRLLGARISQSQSDEMKFMRRWLEIRGEPVEMKMAVMPGSHGHESPSPSHEMTMPGMLSKFQMSRLSDAKGAGFDQLFLKGMIQHHEGALKMVKDLFDTAGAGQDAELFNFATDVDTGQRAEIGIMRNMLGEKPV
ncbi:MAG: DUF305 domain-containing protein [Pyrinomonadaceae bacterium]